MGWFIIGYYLVSQIIISVIIIPKLHTISSPTIYSCFFPPDTPHGQRSKDHLVNIISAPKNPTETKNHVTHTACIDLCLADVAFGPDTTDNDVHTNSPQTKTTRKCTNHTTCHRLLIVPSMWRYPSPNLQITMKKTYNYDPNPNFLGNSLVSRSNVSTL